MTQLYDIDKVFNNANAQFIISGPSSFRGVIKSDVSISIGSNFQTLFEATNMGNLGELANKFMATSSLFTGSDIPNIKLKPVGLTSLFWMGEQSPEFNIPITLLARRSGENILESLMSLYKMVLPTQEGFSDAGGVYSGGNIFVAPLGYNPGSPLENSPAGTFSVSIGKWFKGTQMVMTGVNFDIARIASDKEGNPLYADGSVSFRHYRDVDYNTFRSWFPTVSKQNVADAGSGVLSPQQDQYAGVFGETKIPYNHR